MADKSELEKLKGTPLAGVYEQLDEIIENYREFLEDIMAETLGYDDHDFKEDILRELMQACDGLMSAYQDENRTLPAEFEELNNMLWTWFQDPPETGEKLQDNVAEHLAEMLPYLKGEVVEKKTVSCQATTAKGEPCSNEAKYPEDDPRYCGVHKKKLEENNDDKENETDAEQPAEKVDVEAASEGEVLVSHLDVEPEIAADFLMEANEQLKTLDNLLVEVEDNPDEDSLNELFRSMHSLKGGFGFCGLKTCTELTHAAEDLLGILRDDIPDRIPASWLDLMFATLDSVRSILVAMEEAVDEESRELTIPLSADFVNLLREDLHTACEGETEREKFSSLQKQKEEQGVGERQEVGEETINIELSKISDIVDLVGELVISHSGLRDQLEDHLDYKLENMLNQQDKILDQLQRRSMNLRMLPMKKEFSKFPRIVRDLSRDTGKKVNLNIEGADTEIDKSVLDELHDPLVHLIRNALDHGVELPEERRKAGKPETGQVYLRAYHESGHVYIEVEEDGKGLPRDLIRQKAVERGLIEESEELEPEEIDRLIFNPGFSTADQVTDVSGRGVGMDVVASQIDRLRGTIDIDSTPGEGTKFTIELPLTVAIIDGLIARIGRERVIFPVSQVIESINPEPEDIRHMQEKGRVVRYRDTVIPLIDPGNFMPGAQVNHNVDKRTIMVVVRSSMGEFAIRVDHLYSHEQVVIKKLGKGEIEEADLVSGGAILGDGSVGLILDIVAMIKAYRKNTTE
ncbi:MAG: chemotaxis protein CheA [bacterium]